MDAIHIKRELSSISSFNPRARDGRDNQKTSYTILRYVSIHAPVMDAIIFYF